MNCPQGKMYDRKSSKCHDCPVGYISTQEASFQCTKCPDGYLTRKPGSKTCTSKCFLVTVVDISVDTNNGRQQIVIINTNTVVSVSSVIINTISFVISIILVETLVKTLIISLLVLHYRISAWFCSCSSKFKNNNV